jgi:mannose-6-phosphate isomerase-like protein (cupin superfamily)
MSMSPTHRMLPSHGSTTPTLPKPEHPQQAAVLTVQDGLPIMYSDDTVPVSAVRVVHPTNPAAPSKNHSIVMLYVPPHAEMALHSHETEETYVIISGTGTMRRNGGDVEVGPGHFIYMPAWCDHGIKNTGKEMLTVLLATSPPNP